MPPLPLSFRPYSSSVVICYQVRLASPVPSVRHSISAMADAKMGAAVGTPAWHQGNAMPAMAAAKTGTAVGTSAWHQGLPPWAASGESGLESSSRFEVLRAKIRSKKAGSQHSDAETCTPCSTPGASNAPWSTPRSLPPPVNDGRCCPGCKKADTSPDPSSETRTRVWGNGVRSKKTGKTKANIVGTAPASSR